MSDIFPPPQKITLRRWTKAGGGGCQGNYNDGVLRERGIFSYFAQTLQERKNSQKVAPENVILRIGWKTS